MSKKSAISLDGTVRKAAPAKVLDMTGRQRLNFHLSKENAKKLKHHATDTEQTVQEIVERLILAHLKDV